MKKLILFSTLILIGLFSSFKSVAQNFKGTINNSSTCTVTVTIYDNASNVLFTGNFSTGVTNFGIPTCITGTPHHVDITYSTCTRTLSLSTIPDIEGNVPGYCGFGCGSVQSYNAQMTSGTGCTYFVNIGII